MRLPLPQEPLPDLRLGTLLMAQTVQLPTSGFDVRQPVQGQAFPSSQLLQRKLTTCESLLPDNTEYSTYAGCWNLGYVDWVRANCPSGARTARAAGGDLPPQAAATRKTGAPETPPPAAASGKGKSTPGTPASTEVVH